MFSLMLLWLKQGQLVLTSVQGKTHVVAKWLLLVVMFIACTSSSYGQEQIRQYGIHRNGKRIGALTFSVREQPGDVRLKLDSEVKARMLITFEMTAAEENRFLQNRLVFSSVRRNINGSEKENKTITATGDKYRVNNKGAITPFTHPPIQYSTLCLYAYEPLQVTQVFSDLHQKLLPIQKTGPGRYKVQFPDGKHSEFWYKSGTCTKIILNSQWYTAEMVLEKTQSKTL